MIDFIRPLSNILVTKVGTDAVFECEISKNNSRVQWLKDGQEIFVNDVYGIEAEGRMHRLNVRGVEGKHQGDYAVIVKGHRFCS